MRRSFPLRPCHGPFHRQVERFRLLLLSLTYSQSATPFSPDCQGIATQQISHTRRLVPGANPGQSVFPTLVQPALTVARVLRHMDILVLCTSPACLAGFLGGRIPRPLPYSHASSSHLACSACGRVRASGTCRHPRGVRLRFELSARPPGLRPRTPGCASFPCNPRALRRAQQPSSHQPSDPRGPAGGRHCTYSRLDRDIPHEGAPVSVSPNTSGLFPSNVELGFWIRVERGSLTPGRPVAAAPAPLRARGYSVLPGWLRAGASAPWRFCGWGGSPTACLWQDWPFALASHGPHRGIAPATGAMGGEPPMPPLPMRAA